MASARSMRIQAAATIEAEEQGDEENERDTSARDDPT
jgi:hypothetical protein